MAHLSSLSSTEFLRLEGKRLQWSGCEKVRETQDVRSREEAVSSVRRDVGAAVASEVRVLEASPTRRGVNSETGCDEHPWGGLLRDYTAGSPLPVNSGDWACESMYSRSNSSSSRDAGSLSGVTVEEARVVSVGATPCSGEVFELENGVLTRKRSGGTSPRAAGGSVVPGVGEAHARGESPRGASPGKTSWDNGTLSDVGRWRPASTATEAAIVDGVSKARGEDSELTEEPEHACQRERRGELFVERGQDGADDTPGERTGRTAGQIEKARGKPSRHPRRSVASRGVLPSFGSGLGSEECAPSGKTRELDLTRSLSADTGMNSCHGRWARLNGEMPEARSVAGYPLFTEETSQQQGGECAAARLRLTAFRSGVPSSGGNSRPPLRSGERASLCWSRALSATGLGSCATLPRGDGGDKIQLRQNHCESHCSQPQRDGQIGAACIGTRPRSASAEPPEGKPPWQPREVIGGPGPILTLRSDSSAPSSEAKLGLVQAAVLLWEERLQQQQHQPSGAVVRPAERKTDEAVSPRRKSGEESRGQGATAHANHPFCAGGVEVAPFPCFRDAAVGTEVPGSAVWRLPRAASSRATASRGLWIDQPTSDTGADRLLFGQSLKECFKTREASSNGEESRAPSPASVSQLQARLEKQLKRCYPAKFRINILVTGDPDSGKTTLLNKMFMNIHLVIWLLKPSSVALSAGSLSLLQNLRNLACVVPVLGKRAKYHAKLSSVGITSLYQRVLESATAGRAVIVSRPTIGLRPRDSHVQQVSCYACPCDSSFHEGQLLRLCSEDLPHCHSLALLHQAEARGCVTPAMLGESGDHEPVDDQDRNTRAATKAQSDDAGKCEPTCGESGCRNLCGNCGGGRPGDRLRADSSHADKENVSAADSVSVAAAGLGSRRCGNQSWSLSLPPGGAVAGGSDPQKAMEKRLAPHFVGDAVFPGRDVCGLSPLEDARACQWCVTSLRLAVTSFPLLLDSHSDFLQQDRRYGYPRLDGAPPLSPVFLRLLLVERSGPFLSELAERRFSAFYRSLLHLGEDRKSVSWGTLATRQHLPPARLHELARLGVPSPQIGSHSLKGTTPHYSEASGGCPKTEAHAVEERRQHTQTDMGQLKSTLRDSRSTVGRSGGGSGTAVSSSYSGKLFQRLVDARKHVKLLQDQKRSRDLPSKCLGLATVGERQS
ncbi:septin [Cystoisospora suis]|uniref:Septin n=1 Tax=Cystoisospora suis TaxID=483139 RepID=A0A2C6KYK4_9APIC|nr:septin [Cystoisospora suis]